MYGSRLVAFSVVLLVLLLDGCGKPPVVTLRTAEQLDYNVAEFDPDYQLSAEELHSLIYHSWLEPEGGVVVNSVIKKVLDSVLIDTLAGLDAEFVDLGANWLQHRVYRNQLNNKLTIT